jgi:hypothetical protein
MGRLISLYTIEQSSPIKDELRLFYMDIHNHVANIDKIFDICKSCVLAGKQKLLLSLHLNHCHHDPQGHHHRQNIL